MKYMDIGCNVKCWECTRNCERKELMVLSIILLDIPEISAVVIYEDTAITLDSKNILDFFYFSIINYLKPIAGMLINQGKDSKKVIEDVMELSVSFYVARLKMIEISKET